MAAVSDDDALRAVVWHNPTLSMLGMACAWTWASLALLPAGETALAAAVMGPGVAGVAALLAAEGDAGYARVFYRQASARHSPVLWAALAVPLLAYTALWAGWLATTYPVELAAGTPLPSDSGVPATAPAPGWGADAVRAVGAGLARGVAAAAAAAPAKLRDALPAGVPAALRAHWPTLTLARLPGAALTSFGGALAAEVGWRGFLLSHLLRSKPPARAALLTGAAAAGWHAAVSWASYAAPSNAGAFGPTIAVLDALLQLPLAVGVTALHLASRGSLPLCVAFHTAAAAAARAYAGPLARQVLRTGAGAAGAGSATSGVADPLGALAAESGASGVAAGLWATLANPGRGAGARGADAAEGWNRVDAASALLMGAYVAALPAFAYLLANGAARRRRLRALRAARRAQLEVEAAAAAGTAGLLGGGTVPAAGEAGKEPSGGAAADAPVEDSVGDSERSPAASGSGSEQGERLRRRRKVA
jgi:hypothetical protein